MPKPPKCKHRRLAVAAVRKLRPEPPSLLHEQVCLTRFVFLPHQGTLDAARMDYHEELLIAAANSTGRIEGSLDRNWLVKRNNLGR